MTETATSDVFASVISPILSPLGLDLYDVELTGASGRARTLRVLVERADGTPADIDTIAKATETISPALDADPEADRILGGAYTLEVSSPGLERPLRRADHWRGVVGERVSVKVRIDGAAERFRATVVGVDDESVVLDVDGVERRVELADVTQARTVFEWGPQEKPGRSRDARRKRDKREKVSP
jgi:ribosome maturation factor RimP